MLADSDDGGGSMPPPSDDGADAKKMAEASTRAFFEAGKAGDYAAAASHLSAAITHCQAADYGPAEGDKGAKGVVIVATPHKG